MIWTDEQMATLKADWLAGVPASAIAAKLGVSRGAVAGKRHWLGLEPRTGALLEAAQRFNGLASAATRRSVMEPAGTADAASLAPLVGSRPRLWTTRLPGECCFPVGGSGADTLSCCQPVAGDGLRYCARHLVILAPMPEPA